MCLVKCPASTLTHGPENTGQAPENRNREDSWDSAREWTKDGTSPCTHMEHAHNSVNQRAAYSAGQSMQAVQELHYSYHRCNIVQMVLETGKQQ